MAGKGSLAIMVASKASRRNPGFMLKIPLLPAPDRSGQSPVASHWYRSVLILIGKHWLSQSEMLRSSLFLANQHSAF